MPIGEIDYVSTAPWNDPLNPWPQYAQLTLSAADLSTDTYVLEAFDPNTNAVLYISVNVGYDRQVVWDAAGASYWGIYDANLPDDYLYTLTTARRGIPAGWKQGNTAWVAPIGVDVNSLSIVPDVTQLTPWEYRRRRMLEYV